ncbi:efflux RND transporter periplasmic adaptor subunit [Candidatus Microgenomates bacterium]|nr:efflux RND transporter periplasmic adaptor subunit [Candidatus Microgenomates bacterium]
MKKMLRILKKRWWLVLLVSVVIIIISIQRNNAQKSAEADTYTVKRETLRDVLTFSGSIDAGQKATLQFQSAGRLSYVGAQEGDVVHEGQLIAALDQRLLRKSLEKDLNTYASERLDFDNQKQKYNENGLPGDKYLRQNLIDAFKKAQYDLNNSVLDVELQNISLQYANLTSPINGVLVHAGAKIPGVNITAASTYEIVNPETIYFSAAADQTEVVHLKENMHADIGFDAYPDVKTSGHIISLGYIPKEGETGTVYEVKIGLDSLSNQDVMKYRLGMTGDSSFTLKEYPNVIAIPTTYVKAEGSRKYVYKKVGNKREKTYIQTGAQVDVSTEILNGLQEGDVVYDKAQ